MERLTVAHGVNRRSMVPVAYAAIPSFDPTSNSDRQRVIGEVCEWLNEACTASVIMSPDGYFATMNVIKKTGWGEREESVYQVDSDDILVVEHGRLRVMSHDDFELTVASVTITEYLAVTCDGQPARIHYITDDCWNITCGDYILDLDANWVLGSTFADKMFCRTVDEAFDALVGLSSPNMAP